MEFLNCLVDLGNSKNNSMSEIWNTIAFIYLELLQKSVKFEKLRILLNNLLFNHKFINLVKNRSYKDLKASEF